MPEVVFIGHGFFGYCCDSRIDVDGESTVIIGYFRTRYNPYCAKI